MPGSAGDPVPKGTLVMSGHICVCHTGGAPDIEWMGAGRLSHTAQLPGRPCMEDDAPSVSRAGDGDSVFIFWKNVEFGPCLHHVVVV